MARSFLKERKGHFGASLNQFTHLLVTLLSFPVFWICFIALNLSHRFQRWKLPVDISSMCHEPWATVLLMFSTSFHCLCLIDEIQIKMSGGRLWDNNKGQILVERIKIKSYLYPMQIINLTFSFVENTDSSMIDITSIFTLYNILIKIKSVWLVNWT